MTNWITNLNQDDPKNANGAIQLITSSLGYAASEIGFQELNYKTFEQANYINLKERMNMINAILDQVQAGDTVFFQFPMFAGQRFSEDFMVRLFERDKLKRVAVIVDIPPWMNAVSDDDYDTKNNGWFEWLKRFDLLIVANEKEARHLRRDGVHVPMISVVLGDHMYRGPLRQKRFLKQLHFVSGRKIQGLKYQAATRLNIYGLDASSEVKENPSVVWRGYHPSAAIMASLEGGFGIVTANNNIIESRNSVWQYYTQYNNPTKLSFYLAAGLPVITTSVTPHAQLIRDRHLGLVVDDLNEIDRVLSQLSMDDYQAMLSAVVPWQTAVRSGFFIKRALLAAIQTLNLNLKDQLIH